MLAHIINAAVTFFVVIVLGQILLDHLGIGLHAFRIAGGLVLLLVMPRGSRPSSASCSWGCS